MNTSLTSLLDDIEQFSIECWKTKPKETYQSIKTEYNDNINNWELQGKTSNLLELLENTNDQVVIVFSFASDKLSGRAA